MCLSGELNQQLSNWLVGAAQELFFHKAQSLLLVWGPRLVVSCKACNFNFWATWWLLVAMVVVKDSDCFFECDGFWICQTSRYWFKKTPGFWKTLALVFCNHVLPNEGERWRTNPRTPFCHMGIFLKKTSKKSLWTCVDFMGFPCIVWSPKGVGLIAHLMAPFRPALLAGSWSLGFKMEKWIGSWGLSKIVVTPKDLFSGGILDVHFISFYQYLAAENDSPIFVGEEGSGKYGWLYGILGWLRVKYPNVRVIGKSTYLMVRHTTFTTWSGSLVPDAAFVSVAGVFLLRKDLKQKEHVNDCWKVPNNLQIPAPCHFKDQSFVGTWMEPMVSGYSWIILLGKCPFQQGR